MARDFESGTSDYLESASTPVTAVSFSIAVWFKPESSAAVAVLAGIFDSGTTNNYHHLNISGAGLVRATSAAGGTDANAASGAVTNGVWNHCCATFGPTAGTDRAAYLNGGGKGTSTTNRSPTGVDRLSVGRLGSSSPGAHLDGMLSHLGIWNVQLTDGEVAALARGVHPRLIRPGNLVGYWPLWGTSSPEVDETRNGNDLTVTGAAAVAEQGPVQPLLGQPQDVYVVSAGGPTTYEKTGALTTGALLSGADVFEASETGALTTAALVAGTDVFEAVETGRIEAAGLLAGVAEKTIGGGTTYEKTGALVAGTTLAGGDASTFNRVGSIITSALLSGADVFTAAETGSLTTAGQLRGADVFTAAETGSLTTSGFVSGADVFTASETGRIETFGQLSGVGSKDSSYLKAGSITTGGLLAGADVHEAFKSGALVAGTSLSGLDAFTASETGSLVTSGFMAGGRVFTANRTGSLLTSPSLSGVSLYLTSTVTLDTICTGQLARYGGQLGHIERGNIEIVEGGEIPEP